MAVVRRETRSGTGLPPKPLLLELTLANCLIAFVYSVAADSILFASQVHEELWGFALL